MSPDERPEADRKPELISTRRVHRSRFGEVYRGEVPKDAQEFTISTYWIDTSGE